MNRLLITTNNYAQRYIVARILGKKYPFVLNTCNVSFDVFIKDAEITKHEYPHISVDFNSRIDMVNKNMSNAHGFISFQSFVKYSDYHIKEYEKSKK